MYTHWLEHLCTKINRHWCLSRLHHRLNHCMCLNHACRLGSASRDHLSVQSLLSYLQLKARDHGSIQHPRETQLCHHNMSQVHCLCLILAASESANRLSLETDDWRGSQAPTSSMFCLCPQLDAPDPVKLLHHRSWVTDIPAGTALCDSRRDG